MARTRSRPLLLAGVIAGTMLLGAVVLFSHTVGPITHTVGPKTQGVSALLAWTPAEVVAVWAVDLRQSYDLRTLAADARHLIEGSGNTEAITTIEEWSGAKLEDIAGAVKPVAVLYALHDEEPAWVLVAPLADKVKVGEILRNVEHKSHSPGTLQKIAEVDAHVFEGGPKAQPGYAMVDDNLFLFTTTRALEIAVNTYRGRSPNLASAPQLLKARKRMPAEEGSFFYSPLGPYLTRLADKKIIPCNDQTRVGLTALGYAVGQVDKYGTSDGFLEVDPKGGPLATALLGPATGLGNALDWVPNQMDMAFSLDMHYWSEVYKALSPDTRAAVFNRLLQEIGLTEAEVWETFTGQVVVAFLPKPPNVSGLLMIGLRDTQKAVKVVDSLNPGLELKPDEDGLTHSVGPHTFCLVQKPQPYLLVADGPEAQAWLKSSAARDSSLSLLATLKSADTKKPAPYFFYLGPNALTSVLDGAGKFPLTAGYLTFSPEADGLRVSGGVFQQIAGLVVILVPNFQKARAQGQLTACKTNCKNMATALEMYASDNGGRYPLPGSLDDRLTTGNYLKQIPTCPSAGVNTYSGAYNSMTTPDSFSFQCAGNNHAKAYTGFAGDPTNYPQYDAEQGLLDHP